jgi:hypothetical protein
MYCHKCGKELSNDAYVCTGCGCIVGTTKDVSKNTSKPSDDKIIGVSGLLRIITYAFIAIFIISIGSGIFNLGIYRYKDIYYVYMSEGSVIGSFLSSVCVIITSTISLIFSLKNKDKNLLKCIIELIIGIAIFIVGISAIATIV